MDRDKKGRFINNHKCFNGCEKSWFRKGEHHNISTEFKKGEFTGNKHPLWKGGKHKLGNGYIVEYCPNHPRAYRNKVYQHILVAEKKIGRLLNISEAVHHINGIKDDNRIDNIIVCKNDTEHFKYHHLKTWSRKYNKCQKCGTIERKHEGRGLCVRCFKNVQYHKQLCQYS